MMNYNISSTHNFQKWKNWKTIMEKSKNNPIIIIASLKYCATRHYGENCT